MIGKQVNGWTFIRETYRRKHDYYLGCWRCGCGKICYRQNTQILSGRLRSCGCRKKGGKGGLIQYEGQTFNSLTFIRWSRKRISNRKCAFWKCDCGVVIRWPAYWVKDGSKQDCGCGKLARWSAAGRLPRRPRSLEACEELKKKIAAKKAKGWRPPAAHNKGVSHSVEMRDKLKLAWKRNYQYRLDVARMFVRTTRKLSQYAFFKKRNKLLFQTDPACAEKEWNCYFEVMRWLRIHERARKRILDFLLSQPTKMSEKNSSVTRGRQPSTC